MQNISLYPFVKKQRSIVHQNLSDASLDRRAAMFEMLKPCFFENKTPFKFHIYMFVHYAVQR